MNTQEILSQLEALGSEKIRKQYTKAGAGDNQFGVKRGDLRAIAKKLKTNHELAMALWETDNIDARFLALLIIKPRALSRDDLNRMVRSMTFDQVADWFSAYVLKKHPEKEALRQEWMATDHPMAGRVGWSLTMDRLAKSPDGLDVSGLLDRIESEMLTVDPVVQWTMNFALIEIGVNFAEHRERAVAVGESLGMYRDYPVSKGCVSPFAPIAIPEMARRRG